MMDQDDRIMQAAKRNRETNISDMLDLVAAELTRAYHKHPKPQTSLHEGYAVLLEEVDELWDSIKMNENGNALIEALQVAAMAVRLIIDHGGEYAVDQLRTRDRIKQMGGGL